MNRRDKESVLEEQVVVYRSSNQTEDVDQDAFHEEDILAEHAHHRKSFGHGARKRLSCSRGDEEERRSFGSSTNPWASDSPDFELPMPNQRRKSDSQEQNELLNELQGITELVHQGGPQRQAGEGLELEPGFQTPLMHRPQTTPSLRQHSAINQSAQRHVSALAGDKTLSPVIANDIPVSVELLAISKARQSAHGGSVKKSGRKGSNGAGIRKHPVRFQTPGKGYNGLPLTSLQAPTPAGLLSPKRPPSVTPKSNRLTEKKAGKMAISENVHKTPGVGCRATNAGYVTPPNFSIPGIQRSCISSQIPKTTPGLYKSCSKSQHASRLQPQKLETRLAEVKKEMAHRRERSESPEYTLKVESCFKDRGNQYCQCQWVTGPYGDIPSLLAAKQISISTSINQSHVLAIFPVQDLEENSVAAGQTLHVYPQARPRFGAFQGSIRTASRRNAVLYTVFAAAAAEGALNDIVTEEEAVSNTSIRLTVTVPSKMCKKAYQSVLKTWNNKIAITGYRKGHAPESVLVNQLGGQQRVNNTVLQELIEDVMGTALENAPSAQKAIADSERIEQTGEELEKAFDPNSNFTFSVLFDVLPSVTWTTPYTQLAVTVSNSQSREADIDTTVSKKFRMLLKEGASLRVVSGRGVAMGDVAIIDFSARMADSGQPIPGTDRKGMQLDTETADDTFLPGVSSAMMGMVPGEERQTTITFPAEEDFTPAALRGVTASVDIKVSEVFEWDLPQADDTWASKIMGPGCTVEDVKTRLLENTRAEKEDALRQRIQDAFTEAVAAAVSVDIPDSLIQEAGQNEYSRELNQLLTQGVLSYEQAEKLASPQLLAGYISRKRDDLVNLQKASLGFADILSKEGLIPSEADIEKELSSTLEAIKPVQGSQIDVNAVREQVVRGLETQAAMDWLLANCKVDIVD